MFQNKQVIQVLLTKMKTTFISYIKLLGLTAGIVSGVHCIFAQGDGAKLKYQQVADQIKECEKSKNTYALKKPLKTIEAIWTGEQSKVDWKSLRYLKTKLWFYLLNYVDKRVDPAFNPKDVPEMNISVPIGTNRIATNEVLYAGMPPEGIKDPELRQRYKEALKQNSEKATQYNAQSDLCQLREEFALRLKRYIASAYKLPEDMGEIQELMDLEIPDKATRDKLKDALLGKSKNK